MDQIGLDINGPIRSNAVTALKGPLHERLHMNDETTKDQGQVKIRLPLPLKGQLRVLAEKNRRTVTMEIVARLEHSVGREQPPQGVSQ